MNKREWKKSKSKYKSKPWCKCKRWHKNLDHHARRAYERIMINGGRAEEINDTKNTFSTAWNWY